MLFHASAQAQFSDLRGPRSKFLRRVLQIDALGCAATAGLLIAAARPISPLMGIDNPLVLVGAGLALVPYVAALAWITSREQLNLKAALLGPAVNISAALLCATLLATGSLTLSAWGKRLVGLSGFAVTSLALLQIYGLREATR